MTDTPFTIPSITGDICYQATAATWPITEEAAAPAEQEAKV